MRGAIDSPEVSVLYASFCVMTDKNSYQKRSPIMKWKKISNCNFVQESSPVTMLNACGTSGMYLQVIAFSTEVQG